MKQQLISELLASAHKRTFQMTFENFKNSLAEFTVEVRQGIASTALAQLAEHEETRKRYAHLTIQVAGPDENKEAMDQSDPDRLINEKIIENYCNSLLREEAHFSRSDKLRFNGELKRFGAIFYKLYESGYLQPPMKGDQPNFMAWARSINDHFELAGTELKMESLAKVLNPETDKFDESFYRSFTLKPYKSR